MTDVGQKTSFTNIDQKIASTSISSKTLANANNKTSWMMLPKINQQTDIDQENTS